MDKEQRKAPERERSRRVCDVLFVRTRHEADVVSDVLTGAIDSTVDVSAARVITLSLAAEYRLDELNIDYLSAQEFSDTDALEPFNSWAIGALGRLDELLDARQYLVHNGLSLRNFFGSGDYWVFLSHIARTVQLVNDSVHSNGLCRGIAVVDVGAVPIPGRYTPATFIEIVNICGNQLDVPVYTITPPNQRIPLLKRIKGACRDAFSRLKVRARALRVLGMAQNALVRLVTRSCPTKFYLSDNNWKTAKTYISSLSERSNAEFYFCHDAARRVPLRERIRYRILAYDQRDFFQEAPLYEQQVQQEFLQQIEELSTDQAFRDIFTVSSIDVSPVVARSLAEIAKRDTARFMRNIAATERMFRRLGIHCVILRWSDKKRLYVEARIGSKLDIPTMEVQHGIVAPSGWGYSPIKTRYFAARGSLTKRLLEEMHPQNRDKVVVVGAPVFERLLSYSISENRRDAILDKHGVRRGAPVVLIAGPQEFTDRQGGALTDYGTEKLVEGCFRLARQMPHVHFIFKLHPKSAVDGSMRRKFADSPVNVSIAQTDDSVELVAASSLVISLYSTVIFKALILGSPLIVLAEHGTTYGKKLKSMEDSGAIKIFSQHGLSEERVKSTIERLLFDKSAIQRMRRGAQQFLKENYSFEPAAGKRLASFIARTIH